MQLKRKGEEIYYYSNGNGCDFVVKEGAKVREVLQVCYELNDSSKEREINGLIGAMNKFKLKEAVILTHEQEQELKIKNKSIKVLPVWKWLLT